MIRFVLALFALFWFGSPAIGQGQPPVALYCLNPSSTGSLDRFVACSAANPLQVSAAITPSGTQNVNITQILGAAVSATNPLFVSPATASTPWAVTGSGAAGTAATGVVTVQGIAAMTPLLATLSGTNNINTVTAVTAISNALPAGTNTIGAVTIPGNSFTNITTNADTNVKGSAGTLVGFTVNTIGTTSTVKFFNDADGTCNSGLVGTYTTVGQSFIQVPASMTTGICVQTAGAAAADITVFWR